MDFNHLGEDNIRDKKEDIDYSPNERYRNATQQRLRFIEGFKQFWLRPCKSLSFVTLWLVFSIIMTVIARIGLEYALAYALENPFTAPFIHELESYLHDEGVEIYVASIIIKIGIGAVWIVVFLILRALFIFLGKHPKADKWERDIWNAFSITKQYKYRRPFIISANPAHWTNKEITNKDVILIEIWCKWIRLKRWDKDILDTILESMNMTLCNEPCHKVVRKRDGREIEDSNIIVLMVIPNDKVNKNAAAVDPLFTNGGD
jgi:hypothetical protein